MKPFQQQFTKCSDEGLTENTQFFSFTEFPQCLPAFPTEFMVEEIKSGAWKGIDSIVCGKFGGICSSRHPQCQNLRNANE